MTAQDSKPNSVLSFFSLSDGYERKARFVPAVLSITVLLPAAFSLNVPLDNWLTAIVAGVGLYAVFALGLSHLASALGNRLQRQLWPRWPHDAPTHVRLSPNDSTCSKQQREQWYAAIRRLTGLDIAKAAKSQEPIEIQSIINDALTQVCNLLWRSEHASRLQLHNADYGLARNLTGLRVVWVPLALIGTVTCWGVYGFWGTGFVAALVSTLVAVGASLLAYCVLPHYVVARASDYADSFFAAMMALDGASTAD